MALRVIRFDGDPILRKKSKKIDKIDDRLLELLDDMVETMVHANGVGLAAPQIGILKRALVIDIGEGPIKVLNPKIVKADGELMDVEGCLSVPNLSGEVPRPENIVVEYMDEKGDKRTLEANGLLARVFCHEIDHLDGILYTDKATEIYENEDQEEDEEN